MQLLAISLATPGSAFPASIWEREKWWASPRQVKAA